MYQLRISEPIVLANDGYIYDKTQAPDWDDPDLNVIDKRIAIELDWKSLDFPRKGSELINLFSIMEVCFG